MRLHSAFVTEIFLTLHRVRSTLDFNDRTQIEILMKHLSINGGRHENNTQVGISCNHITQNNQCKISLEIENI